MTLDLLAQRRAQLGQEHDESQESLHTLHMYFTLGTF